MGFWLQNRAPIVVSGPLDTVHVSEFSTFPAVTTSVFTSSLTNPGPSQNSEHFRPHQARPEEEVAGASVPALPHGRVLLSLHWTPSKSLSLWKRHQGHLRICHPTTRRAWSCRQSSSSGSRASSCAATVHLSSLVNRDPQWPALCSASPGFPFCSQHSWLPRLPDWVRLPSSPATSARLPGSCCPWG